MTTGSQIYLVSAGIFMREGDLGEEHGPENQGTTDWSWTRSFTRALNSDVAVMSVYSLHLVALWLL